MLSRWQWFLVDHLVDEARHIAITDQLELSFDRRSTDPLHR